MEVIWIHELTDGSEYGAGLDERYAVRPFQALVSESLPANLTHIVIKAALGNTIYVNPPVYVGSGHPGDPNKLCKNIVIRAHDKSRTLYDITAHYEARSVWMNMVEAQIEDPLQRPIKIEMRSMTVNRPVEQDLDGKPITNSSNIPYDPSIEVQEIYPILAVQQNERFLGYGQMMSKMQTYCGAINSSQYLGAPAKTLKVMLDANMYYEIQPYWTVSYELIYRADGWDKDGQILDCGYMEWISDSQIPSRYYLVRITHPRTQIVNGEAVENDPTQPVSQPWPLDGEGRALTKEEAIWPDNYVYRSYKVYREVDFNGLGLRVT